MILFFVFVFGVIIGSFLNVVILRLPEDQSLNGRSHCMHCGHVLATADLVPLFSYLWLKGKCRYCQQPISPRYFIIELLSGVLAAGAYYLMQPGDFHAWFVFARTLFVIFVLAAVFTIDLEHFLILDKIVFPAATIVFIFNVFGDYFNHAGYNNSQTLAGIYSAAGLFLFFWAIYKLSSGTWIGFGDVKFAIFLGLATPFPIILVNIFLAYAIGAAVGIVLILSGSKKLSSEVPFGTFLSVSTLIAIFYGAQLLNWYMHFLNGALPIPGI